MTLGLAISILLGLLQWTGEVDLAVWQILLPIMIEVGIQVIVLIIMLVLGVGFFRREGRR